MLFPLSSLSSVTNAPIVIEIRRSITIESPGSFEVFRSEISLSELISNTLGRRLMERTDIFKVSLVLKIPRYNARLKNLGEVDLSFIANFFRGKLVEGLKYT